MNTEDIDPPRETATPRALGKDRKSAAMQPLLSPERSQKLDLLLHLIANIPEGLVLCGPLGIGKTTILDLVEAANLDTWSICRFNASSTTQFGDIQNKLAESGGDGSVGASKPIGADDLERIATRFKRSNRLLVLLIDDAGELAPGVVTSVCQLADSYPALRPVFTMTADRLHLMSSSDPAIGSYQVIELPPLTENQCGEFLKNLSGRPGALISFNAITPNLVEHVYRESHGVPGRVLSLLPSLSEGNGLKKAAFPLPAYAAITLVAATCIGYLIWQDQQRPSVPVAAQLEPFSQRNANDPEIADRAGFGGETESARLTEDTVPAVSGSGQPVVLDSSASPAVEPDARRSQGLAFSSRQPENPESPAGQETDSRVAIRQGGAALGPAKLDQPENTGVSPDVEDGKTNTSDSAPVQNGSRVGEIGASLSPQPGDILLPPDATKGPMTVFEREAGRERADVATLMTDDAKKEENSEPGRTDTQKKKWSFTGVQDDGWIKNQNAKHYTLQLLAVKKFDAMEKFIHAHSELEGLALFKAHKKGSDWYCLIQGAYPSARAANQASKKLPSGLRKPWLRSFKSVQNGMIDFEIN